jgi:hypothetical protein
MTELSDDLRRNIAHRADQISQNDGDLMVTRALARPASRGPWPRHGLNIVAALGLSLVVIAGGIVLETQLRGLRLGAPGPTAGPLPSIPNEIVNLDNVSQGSDVVTPFRLKDGKVLDPRPRWIVAPGKALMVTSGGLCDLTTIHVVDLGSPPHDTTTPVSLPGCYFTPTIVPNSTTVLLDHVVGTQPQTQDLGTVAYDWAAGRVVGDYPNVPKGYLGGLASSDGRLLFTLDGYGAQLAITDLTTDTNIAYVSAPVTQVGLNAGGMALSPDGRTLYVNEGTGLRTFDALTGKAGPILDFKEQRTSPTAQLPSWLTSLLPSIGADAKEGLEPGHGIAVDPKGRWVAALGVNDPSYEGIWVFNTSGSMPLARRIPDIGWRAIAASLDGSVLYGLETEAQQGAIAIIDPHTGQMRKLAKPQFSDILGIAGIERNVP